MVGGSNGCEWKSAWDCKECCYFYECIHPEREVLSEKYKEE